jgi:isoquinoline 1-oxidoreductase alpha subunit
VAKISTILIVNNRQYPVNVDSGTPLLWVLRDEIGLTGTKYGCGIEVCGACTVLVNGEPEKSCDMSVNEAVGKQITTIEGLSADRSHPVQKAWLDLQVPQCGYCQSGMILKVAALLSKTKNPTDAQIDNAIGNICVCGTYQRIRAAIHSAAKA